MCNVCTKKCPVLVKEENIGLCQLFVGHTSHDILVLLLAQTSPAPQSVDTATRPQERVLWWNDPVNLTLSTGTFFHHVVIEDKQISNIEITVKHTVAALNLTWKKELLKKYKGPLKVQTIGEFIVRLILCVFSNPVNNDVVVVVCL